MITIKLSEDTAPWHRALQGLENSQTGPDLGLAEGGCLEYINIYIRKVMPTWWSLLSISST